MITRRCWISFCILLLFVFSIVSISNSNSTGSNSSELILRKPAIKPSHTIVDKSLDINHITVKFTDDFQVRKHGNKLISAKGRSISNARKILNQYLDGRMRRLFSKATEKHLDRERDVLQSKTNHELADLNSYYRIEVAGVYEAEQLINELNNLECVEIAYFEPQPEPAVDIDPPTPDYLASQDYREAAPVGIDADYANTLPGGDGTGVKIIDIEGAWQSTHEDLDKAVGGLIGETEVPGTDYNNHGTAVIGVMIASDNGYGVTGICPGADIGMVAVQDRSTAEALYLATANLQPGDIILIELHAPGPHYNFQIRPDQKGYICMEYWQANFDAILYAWAKGIVVVEAGGNGGENYDDYNLYSSLFDTTYRNSHAIIIGAGYEAASPLDLEKYSWSNFGDRVNLQGYGGGVYTTGYGDLFAGGGDDEDQYYTSDFGGTSSASPVVTGAIACLQGYYKNQYGAVLTSDMIRDILVPTGTPQQGNISEHIGPRPDLLAAIPILSPPPSLYTNPIMLEDTLDEGDIITHDIYLINRSVTDAVDFSIIDDDSLNLKVDADWLQASPQTGTVPPADSVIIEVTLDADVIGDRINPYRGILDISWGISGNPLDSLTRVPVYLKIPCFDDTYTATSSLQPEGPTFYWISARDIGSKIPDGSFYGGAANPLDDGSTGPVTLGFDFEYYGQEYNQVYIGVNGAISFTDPDVNAGGYFSNFDIPGTPFSSFVAPFWNDLIIDPEVDPEAGIYVYKSLDTIVIEWYHLANFNVFGDTDTDFEVILTRNDRRIVFQYNNIGNSDLEETALIGISAIECENLSYFDSGDIPENMVSNLTAIEFVNNTGTWTQSGDMNASGSLDISDLTYMVAYLFDGGPSPIPEESADMNCSGQVDVSDLTYIVEYLFNGGSPPCYFWMVL